MTKEEQLNQLMQSKEEVKAILYTDSSSVGLCFTFDEIVKLVKNKKEDETNKLSEEDVNNLNRISLIIHEAGQVQNWWRDESLISREESNKLVNWLKSFYNKLKNNMDYEKLYKEALELARDYYKSNVNLGEKDEKSMLEDIFPELKESEDERIKTFLHHTFTAQYLCKDKLGKWHGEPVANILSWLEKQGEKPQGKTALEAIREEKVDNANKVEPKFHKGDWITNGNAINHISKIRDDGFYCFDYGPSSDMIQYIDNTYHLWTIQDAEEGDVLEFGDHGRLVTGILSFVNKTTGKVDVSCLLEGDKFKVGVFYNLDTVKPHPTTKEQRELLFQKMKEAGYEWDEEKKQLKKIEQSELTEFEDSVKDMMNAYRDSIGANDVTTEEVKKHAAYLLSLIPHKSAEWSEKDENFFADICTIIDADRNFMESAKRRCKDWLKSLRQRMEE